MRETLEGRKEEKKGVIVGRTALARTGSVCRSWRTSELAGGHRSGHMSFFMFVHLRGGPPSRSTSLYFACEQLNDETNRSDWDRSDGTVLSASSSSTAVVPDSNINGGLPNASARDRSFSGVIRFGLIEPFLPILDFRWSREWFYLKRWLFLDTDRVRRYVKRKVGKSQVVALNRKNSN